MDNYDEFIKKAGKFYQSFVNKNGYIPSNKDLGHRGFTKHLITKHFATVQDFHDFFNVDCMTDADFTLTYVQDIKRKVSEHKKFVITSAVNYRPSNKRLMATLDSYCKKNDALLLVLPVKDVNRQTYFEWCLHKDFVGRNIVSEPIKLSKHLTISNIQVNAKQVDPLVGLKRIVQKIGCMVLGGTKFHLNFIANQKSKIPRAAMTTGACTHEYLNRSKMTRRGMIAEADHQFGAIVIEMEDDGTFQFRQLESNQTGVVYDLGFKYDGSKKTKCAPKSIVLGDWHTGHTDPKIKSLTYDILEKYPKLDVFLHDMMDGDSINHHCKDRPIARQKKKFYSLREEGKQVFFDLEAFASLTKGKLYWVASNHCQFIDKYLESSRYTKEDVNFKLGHHLVSDKLASPKKSYVELLLNRIADEFYSEGFKLDRVIFLNESDSKLIDGIECAIHGHGGLNGAKGSTKTFREHSGPNVTGHSHTSGIYGQSWVVGTSTKLRLAYNPGLSSWTHAHCLIYPGGIRQLIHMFFPEETRF